MAASSSAEPVTVVLTRQVRGGHETEFREKLQAHLERVTALEGHRGVNIIEPTGSDRTWRFIIRFDHPAAHEAWSRSAMRSEWERSIAPHTIGEPRIRAVSGLETWFTLGGLGVVQPPPRWKMAATTWLAIYPTITTLLLIAQEPLTAVSTPVRTLLLTGLLVPLMTYVLMPGLTRLLRGWLYPAKPRTETSR